MAHIWLDITTIKGWQRPPVGVVRVEAECCRHALAQGGASVRFCCFERENRRYVELSRDAAAQILAQRAAPSVAEPETLRATMTGRAKQLVRRAIWMLPARRQEPALRKLASVYRFARDSYVFARTAWQRMHDEIRAARAARAPIEAAPPDEALGTAPFRSGDVYVSMGLDWDHKDLDYLYRLKKQLGFKALLFCYDLIPVLLPHLCVGNVAPLFGHYFSGVAWCADKVLCISESSRRDLQRFCDTVGAPHCDTAIVHLGSDLRTNGSAIGDEVASIVDTQYILYVSTIERRKNHEVLYRAYTRLAAEGIVLPTLIFVGMQGWGVGDMMADFELDPRVKAKIRVLNHVSDIELAELFRHARFTVYPSLYEGWGLPLAEGLAYGKFCLCSNSSSLPEVGGDLVEYLDPWDTPAWTARLRWYIEHPEAVAQRETAIRERYRTPTWDETGTAVFAHARSLLDDTDGGGPSNAAVKSAAALREEAA
jgi:glycosyltransferase involved in cell wall biosynthesis